MPLPFGDQAHAPARELVGSGAVDPPARDEHVAAGRRELTRDHPQRGRLPSPVRTEQRDQAAEGDAEIDAAQHGDGAVGGVHVSQLERGRAPSITTPSRNAPVTRSRLRGTRHERGIGTNLVGSAGRDHLAEVEHVDAVAHLHDQRHVVLHEEDRETVVVREPAQESLERLRLVVGLARCRLVEQEHARLDHQRPPELDDARGSRRDRRHVGVGQLGQADQLEHALGLAGHVDSPRSATDAAGEPPQVLRISPATRRLSRIDRSVNSSSR